MSESPAIAAPAETPESQASAPGSEARGDGAPVPPPEASQPAPPSAAAGHPSWAFLLVLTVANLAADLGTKWWAKAHLAGVDGKTHGSKHLTVIHDHLDLIYAQNPGGAWSFLRSLPEYVRRPFFLFISAAAIVFIVSIYRRVRPEQWAMKWGLPLALGGAMGNLVDRIRYGYVVDFIDVYVTRGSGQEHHWPTFNVADIAICVGVLLMAVDMLVVSRRSARAADAADSASHEPAPGT